MYTMTMSLLESAIQLAVEAHSGQRDKAGRPYILHPLAVMFAAEKAYQAHQPSLLVTLEEFMAAAILHDVSEDHFEKYPLSLIHEKFGDSVYEIVDGVTRRQGETYMEFIRRAYEDPGSCLLKILDINHNLSRISALPLAEQTIRRRYEKALVVLNTRLTWEQINAISSFFLSRI